MINLDTHTALCEAADYRALNPPVVCIPAFDGPVQAKRLKPFGQWLLSRDITLVTTAAGTFLVLEPYGEWDVLPVRGVIVGDLRQLGLFEKREAA